LIAQPRPRVAVTSATPDVTKAVARALEEAGILERVTAGTRLALKPNFTYPYYRPGVTTSPEVIGATVRVLQQRGARVAIVETDGGYGAWRVQDAFAGHGMHALAAETGAELVNLCDEPSELVSFRARGRCRHVPLPVRLLRGVDLFITMPVPKIHCMTGLTLSMKNQWGCIPDIMRLRRHYLFDEAVVAINAALKPVVLGDGTYFLDHNGPMDGTPVRMDLIIAATNVGAFDRYVSELMGVEWRTVSHLRKAVARRLMPASLNEIEFNTPPGAVNSRRFTLHRTPRNWIALAGFRSRMVTWLGYESWFGKVILHGLLYAIAGKPVKPADGRATPS
jgi:uncharacterized protein (DUF362 family)